MLQKNNATCDRGAKRRLLFFLALISIAVGQLTGEAVMAQSLESGMGTDNGDRSSPHQLLITNTTDSQGSEPRAVRSGRQVIWNGRTWPGQWIQWQLEGDESQTRYGIGDTDLMQVMGVELLNTANSTQPVRWFSDPLETPLAVPTRLTQQVRYLDITELAKQWGWQLQVDGETLRISSTPARVEAIQEGQHPWGDRIVLDLDRPTSFQVSSIPIERTPQTEDPNPDGVTDSQKASQPMQEFTVTIDAHVAPALKSSFLPIGTDSQALSVTQGHRDRSDAASISTQNGQWPDSSSPSTGSRATENRQGTTDEGQMPLKLEQTGWTATVRTESDRTTIRVQIPQTWRPQVWTQPDPRRLIIDIRPDFVDDRDIAWAPGLRWRQKLVDLGTDRFSVVWLEVNPRQSGVSLRPIADSSTLNGIAPLSEIAEQAGAAAAINGGFFNRNNQLPLGAIRREGRWLSSPILNRGAIAWNDAGTLTITRLSMEETLIAPNGERLPVLFLNSGYVKAGISRYTPEWGSTYTPLIDNEIIVVVEKGRVTQQLRSGAAGETDFPIPSTGYLLTFRAFESAAQKLSLGTRVRLERETVPAYLEVFPHILGAGPVLLRNGLIVLDAKAEQFSDNFAEGKASRSAIGQTQEGTILIAAVHNRTDGPGPTLTEMAEIMQQLGAVDALNLDGGGSTTLYLGGQLLEHPPRIVPRIHNGLGIFIQPHRE